MRSSEDKNKPTVPLPLCDVLSKALFCILSHASVCSVPAFDPNILVSKYPKTMPAMAWAEKHCVAFPIVTLLQDTYYYYYYPNILLSYCLFEKKEEKLRLFWAGQKEKGPAGCLTSLTGSRPSGSDQPSLTHPHPLPSIPLHPPICYTIIYPHTLFAFLPHLPLSLPLWRWWRWMDGGS